MKLSRNVRVDIPEDFLEEIAEELSSDFIEEFEKLQQKAAIKINKSMKDFIKNHPVSRAIEGEFAGSTDGSDLQAEFGLTDQMASRSVALIQEKLKDSIKFNIDNHKGTKTFFIELSCDLDESYKDNFNEYPFVYDRIAKGNGKVRSIKWMPFLLEAASKAIGNFITDIKDYGISYNSDGDSSSGRATMTKNKDLADRFPYSVNKRFVSFGGENFIDEAFSSNEFQNIVYNILEDFLDKVIDEV